MTARPPSEVSAALRATGGKGQGGPLKAEAADLIDSLVRERDEARERINVELKIAVGYHERARRAEATLSEWKSLAEKCQELVRETESSLRETSAALVAMREAASSACVDVLGVAAKAGFAGMPDESDRLQRVDAELTAILKAPLPALASKVEAVVKAAQAWKTTSDVIADCACESCNLLRALEALSRKQDKPVQPPSSTHPKGT